LLSHKAATVSVVEGPEGPSHFPDTGNLSLIHAAANESLGCLPMVSHHPSEGRHAVRGSGEAGSSEQRSAAHVQPPQPRHFVHALRPGLREPESGFAHASVLCREAELVISLAVDGSEHLPVDLVGLAVPIFPPGDLGFQAGRRRQPYVERDRLLLHGMDQSGL
jgi:hypothetical protein